MRSKTFRHKPKTNGSYVMVFERLYKGKKEILLEPAFYDGNRTIEEAENLLLQLHDAIAQARKWENENLIG